MTISTHKIEHLETAFDAVVRIDHNHPKLKDAIRETVEFWSGWEFELDLCDDDYLLCFLKKLGRKLVLVQLQHGWLLNGAISYMAAEEGWPPLDGSCGITLVAVDTADVDIGDIRVEEVTP